MYTKNHDQLDTSHENKSSTHRDHDRFVKEVWAINYFRIQLIIKILIAIFAALLLFDIAFDKYPVLFSIHLSAIGCSLLYWGMTALAKKRGFNDSIYWQMAFVLSYCFLMVTAFGFTALFYYIKDLIIYLLPVFAVGLFILLSPKHSFIFFATTHSIFVLTSIFGTTDTYIMLKNIVNSTIAVILVLVFMRLTFQMKQHEFEQRIIIEERTAELETINQRLHELATTDELTDLPNRRVFIQSLEQEMERAHRHRRREHARGAGRRRCRSELERTAVGRCRRGPDRLPHAWYVQPVTGGCTPGCATVRSSDLDRHHEGLR